MDTVRKIIEYLGGESNISAVTNCMTRLRVVVIDDASVDVDLMKQLPEVLGIVHDRPLSYEIVVGPGRSRKYADICHEMGFKSGEESPVSGEDTVMDNRKTRKENSKNSVKENKIKSFMKTIGEIFVPLLPGIIAAGLCAGFASLIKQFVPDYESVPVWMLIYTVLTLINISFMTYINAWAGYRAAERFGATPILGGMLGMITSLSGIDTIARILSLYNEEAPLSSVLCAGKGGVLAVILGVFLLAQVEKNVRRRVPDNFDIILTPILSMIIILVPYILIVMPVFGFIASLIVKAFSAACMSTSTVVRIITGFIASACFLPLVAAGMHHGLVALYSVQLQELGYVTLYPALAMAGAGQVGAAIAILIKSKRVGNKRLTQVIRGALPAGFLGIGEPLIYGVTLPLGKPFILAGLGAGFGGAFVMLMQVASTTWGPSGLIGAFVMTGGPKGAAESIICYLIGLAIAYVMSFIITYFYYSEEELRKMVADETVQSPADAHTDAGSKTGDGALEAAASDTGRETVNAAADGGRKKTSHRIVNHGDAIDFGEGDNDGGQSSFTHIVRDPMGLHARPAAELMKIVRKYKSHVAVDVGAKTADAGSLVQLLALGVVQGNEITVRAVGEDAVQVLGEIKRFLEERV
ncbi:MAG: HPr family phosphocarrier protein [Lachnospiraceae bacterium]|nr:HPr family phosphocarrier protein [Lachnospiraceae bacterium]